MRMSNNQQIVVNRIKATLVEKQRTSRWLAEQMGKSENTNRDGAPIKHNRLFISFNRLRLCWVLIFRL